MTLVETPGASNANSYLSVQDAQNYFDTHLYPENWDNSSDQSVALVMATRVINTFFIPRRVLHQSLHRSNNENYYLIARTWTGIPSTTTQSLAWPRIGMYDRNGNPIPSTVIPIELKEATAELAGTLSKTNVTADNDVIVQGITSVKAGSVSLTFKDVIDAKVLPDMVLNLMPQSWFTDEIIEQAQRGTFEMI